MSKRAVCDCGREHEHIEIDGARVLGCPKCLTEGEGAEAMRELIRAAKEHMLRSTEREETSEHE